MDSAGKASRWSRTGGGIAGVLSLTALATLAACSGPVTTGGTSVDVGLSSHSQPVSPAPPGKYQTLPEPCGAVDGAMLRTLLPSSQDYAGDATPTYDIDRRVGCRWTGSAGGAIRTLSIDLERVVSYDPAVSDNDRAAQDFAQLAQAAHVPPIPAASPSAPAPSASGPTPDSVPPSSSASAAPSSPASAAASTPASAAASASAGQDDGADGPRRVGGIGDEAYLDDTLVTQGADVHRDVTLVFRTANVLVTVVFTQYATDSAAIPPSGELQLGADGVAQELARQFD